MNRIPNDHYNDIFITSELQTHIVKPPWPLKEKTGRQGKEWLLFNTTNFQPQPVQELFGMIFWIENKETLDFIGLS